MSLKDQERKLDEEFAKLGVKPYMYHFTKDIADIWPFKAITIVDSEKRSKMNYWSILSRALVDFRASGSKLTAAFLEFVGLQSDEGHYFGVAICSVKDNFDRRKGRIIAKGRLLKQLKETMVMVRDGRLELNRGYLIIAPIPEPGEGYYHSISHRIYLTENLRAFLEAHKDIQAYQVSIYELREVNR